MSFDAGAVIGRLELNIKGWTNAVETVKKDQASLSGLIMRHDAGIKKLGQTFTVAGGIMVASLGAMIKKTADAGDEMNDLSQRTGIATEILSGYKLAADKSGTSIEGFATGMKGLSRVMVEAASGGKEAQDAFKDVGVSATDSAGKVRPLDQVMLDVADRFAAMPDGAEKNALAMKLFGKAGMDLIPMLNMGRKGLEENAAAAKRYGMVISQEAAKKCDEFNDSLAELQGSMGGIGREIATALMPTVKGLIESVRDIAVKVREWIAEHPTLTSWIAKLTLGMGALASLVGPMVFMLPKLAQGWHTVALALERANLAKTAMGALWTVALGLTVKYVTAQMDLAKAENYAADAGDRLHETEDKLVERLSEAAVAADWQFGRMSKLIEAYHGNIGALAMAIQKGKEGKDIQEALAQVSEKDAAAYDKWKKATEGVVVAQKTLGDTLKEYGILLIGEKSKKVTELLVVEGQLTELYKRGKIDSMEYGKGIQKVYEELKKLGTETATHVLPPVREFQDLLKKAPGQFSDVTFKAFDFEESLRGVADQAMVSENTVLAFLYNVRAQFLRTMGIMVPEWEGFSGAAEVACRETKGFMDEVSTVVSDAMRNIAKSIAGVIDFKKLFGAAAKEVKFDTSPFDALTKAAQAAYDKIRGLADSEYDAQERQITRAQEDEDRRYKHEYDLKVKGIRDSAMTEEQKQAAIEALDIQYEEAQIARERQREDEKYAREEAQKAKLLALETAHELDLQKIRDDADKARQKLADDEEKRQNSLWFKVKGIFATAVEEMATVWLTQLIAPLAESIGGFFASLADKGKKAGTDMASGLSSGLGSVSTTLTTLATSIGTVITTLATAVGTGIVTIATSIASAIVALATGIASAAAIIAAASEVIIIAAVIGLAIFAAYTAIKGLLGGGGGKQTDVTFWLKIISDNIQNILNWTIGGITVQLQDYIKAPLDMANSFQDRIARATEQTRDWVGESLGWMSGIAGWLRSIDGRFGDLKSAAGGAVSTATELVMVHGSPAEPEYIIPGEKLGAVAGVYSGAAGPRGGNTVNLIVNLNGKMIATRDFIRGDAMPEIIQALKSGIYKAEIQQALGVA